MSARRFWRSETSLGAHQSSSVGSSSFRLLPPAILSSVIFCCSHATIAECMDNLIFGLPYSHFAYVQNVQPGMPVFLFECSERKMLGVFEAVSGGKLNINPHGWTRNTGKTPFPAQVQVKVVQNYPPLPECIFKKALMENYYTAKHFYYELDGGQTSKLWSLFFQFSSPLVIEPQRLLPCEKAFLPREQQDTNTRNKTAESVTQSWMNATPYNAEARKVTLNDSDDSFLNNDVELEKSELDDSKVQYAGQDLETGLVDVVLGSGIEETGEYAFAEVLVGLRCLQALLMESKPQETTELSTRQTNVSREQAYKESFYQNLDCSIADKGPDKTEGESGTFLQQQKQLPHARLNHGASMPRTQASSPNIDELGNFHPSKDFQDLMMGSSLQERSNIQGLGGGVVQEAADLPEWEEVAAAWYLQELATTRKEHVKETGSPSKRSFFDNDEVMREHYGTEAVQKRQRRSELQSLVMEICTELGYLLEIDQLRQRNAELEYKQAQMALEIKSVKYRMEVIWFQFNAMMQASSRFDLQK